MWIEVNLATFECSVEGFVPARNHGAKQLYVSPELAHLKSIDDLASAEYGQAVEVDRANRSIAFGRDYLGHFPLAYAVAGDTLFIGDEISRLVAALRRHGTGVTLSAESVALYFSLGYVPDGLTLYKEVSMCEAHSVYRWRNGVVSKRSLFRPVAIDPAGGLEQLESAIEEDVTKWSGLHTDIDVWCSGGLDSSIMAQRFNDEGRRARLLTLAYGRNIHQQHGDGERRYAYEAARAVGAPIREVTLTPRRFKQVHRLFSRTHNMPVIDTCVPAKYALAQASGSFVITGEGSDPLFAGPKNNMMLHAVHRNADLSLGWLYALAHRRFFQNLGEIFTEGPGLAEYVSRYMDQMFDRYPGDLLRKLFYLNIHVKAASLIFTESYYASRSRRLEIRHPYAALGVYEAAFRLDDSRKYAFPNDKLTLKAIYGARIPRSILTRKKSGTMMPLTLYLGGMRAEDFEFGSLESTGLFNKSTLRRMRTKNARATSPLLVYALMTLNEWIRQTGGNTHAHLPTQSRRHQKPQLAAALR